MEQVTLTIIQYDTAADHTFLVLNTTTIYGVFEDQSSGSNAMVASLTQQQKDVILSKGYYIQDVEVNPTMTNYVLLQHANSGQGRYLSDLGKVYVLTDKHTLLRLTDGTQFSQTGKAAEFTQIPLEDMRTELAKQNNVDLTTESVETILSPTISARDEGTNQIQNQSAIFALIGVAVFTIIILAIVLWRRFRTNDSVNPPVSPLN